MAKSEALTRSELIDHRLALSGWNTKDPTQVVEEFDILTAPIEGVAEPRTPYEGHQFSDYVLLGKNGKPMAVIEAKKTNNDAAIGREQAKQYCNHIQTQHGGELPFCFYTNGHEILLLESWRSTATESGRLSHPAGSRTSAYIRRNRSR